MDWINLAEDSCLVLVECGNEPLGSIKCREFLLSEELLPFQEGLCSMELVYCAVRNCVVQLQL